MIQQIIIDGIYLPRVSHDRYFCREDLLSENITMISGRVVQEVRGKVWRAGYSFDCLDSDLRQQLLKVLRCGRSFPASVLPDDRDTMVASQFLVESLTPPTFAFEEGGKPVWHNLGFTIREVTPHDQ